MRIEMDLMELLAIFHAHLKSIRIMGGAFSSLNSAQTGKLAADLMRSLSLKDLIQLSGRAPGWRYVHG